MTLQIILSFLTYSAITSITPGPNNLVMLSNSSNYGFKKSLDLFSGLYTGFLCVMFICVVCCFSLTTLIPKITPFLKYIGAVYIVWLAWHVATGKPAEEGSEEGSLSFKNGFLLQFVNAKIILCGLAVLTGFVLPHSDSFFVALLFGFLFATLGALGNIIWGVAGSVFQRVFKKYYKALNIVMALLLLECAVSMLLAK